MHTPFVAFGHSPHLVAFSYLIVPPLFNTFHFDSHFALVIRNHLILAVMSKIIEKYNSKCLF